MYVGKVLRRFLNDEQGVASALELDCLKKKHGVTNNIPEQAITKVKMKGGGGHVREAYIFFENSVL